MKIVRNIVIIIAAALLILIIIGQGSTAGDFIGFLWQSFQAFARSIGDFFRSLTGSGGAVG